MKRAIQRFAVGAAMRLVHAALVELRSMDDTVAAEFATLPAGTSYAIFSGHNAPALYVQWDGHALQRLKSIDTPHCTLQIKALPLSFRIFTGQIGLAQAYAQHAFTIAGDIADVMRLARLVNRTESYLFPPLITRRFLAVLPRLPASPLRLYGKLIMGFLRGKY